jgi:hypothetical protein
MLSEEHLNKQLVELKAQLKLMENNYHQCLGAILVIEEQLKEIKKGEDVEKTN